MEAPPSKKDVMLALLERAEASVHLDPRKEGVELPAHLRAERSLRLDYGYHLRPPIPNLSVDERGISATLSFNRTPFSTFVPWEAVYLIADFDGRGAVWKDDIPAELMTAVRPEEAGEAPGAKPRPRTVRRLASVPAPTDQAAATPPTAPAVATPSAAPVAAPLPAPTPAAGPIPTPAPAVAPVPAPAPAAAPIAPAAPAGDDATADGPGEPPPRSPRPSHLRLVK